MDLKEEFKLTFIFISHDLNVVHYISDRVLVMYLGQVVEIGDVSVVYSNPKHPYTRALISAMLSMNPEKGQRRCHCMTHQTRISPPSAVGLEPGPIFGRYLCFKRTCTYSKRRKKAKVQLATWETPFRAF